MLWELPASPTSKSPLRGVVNQGPVGTTFVTLTPILLH